MASTENTESAAKKNMATQAERPEPAKKRKTEAATQERNHGVLSIVFDVEHDFKFGDLAVNFALGRREVKTLNKELGDIREVLKDMNENLGILQDEVAALLDSDTISRKEFNNATKSAVEKFRKNCGQARITIDDVVGRKNEEETEDEEEEDEDEDEDDAE